MNALTTCNACEAAPMAPGQEAPGLPGYCWDCLAAPDEMASPGWSPTYSPWRHGGWYVTNISHPSGGCGCVSRNYGDRKWRIVCFDDGRTFPNRDAAAYAERDIALRAAAGTAS